MKKCSISLQSICRIHRFTSRYMFPSQTSGYSKKGLTQSLYGLQIIGGGSAFVCIQIKCTSKSQQLKGYVWLP